MDGYIVICCAYLHVGKLHGHSPIALTVQEEKELCAYITEMANRGLPVSRRDVKCLAQSIDNLHDVQVFKHDGPTDGWLTSFMRRHPEITLRRPSIIDGGRFAMARKSTIDAYFKGMRKLFNSMKLDSAPNRIYNLDETGFSREPK